MSTPVGSALQALQPPSVKLPIRPGLALGAGLAAAILVGALIAIDPRFGLAALLAVVAVPAVLINLPLGVILWTPLAFINAVALVGLASMGLLALIAVGWISVAPSRRELLRTILTMNKGMAAVLAFLTAWVTLSVAWAADPGEAVTNVWNWYLAMAGFVAIATTITKPKYMVAVMLALVVGAIMAATVGFMPIDGGGQTGRQEGRIAGGLGDPNYLAAGLVAALAIAAGLAATTRSKGLRWGLIAAMGYMLIGLAATGSRGGLLAAAMAIIAAVILIRSSSVKVGVIIAAALAAIGLWMAANSSGTWERIREFDTRGTGRVDLWDVALRMSEDHLLTGVGVNNFRTVSAQYVRQPGSPTDIEFISEQPHVVHNIYLQQLAETGVVGLGLFLTAIAVALRTGWQAIRRLEAAGAARLADLGRSVFIAQIGALGASLFLSNAYDPRWILLALSPALRTLAWQAEPRGQVP